MMTKGNKVALKHAANAIEGIRPVGGVALGGTEFIRQTTTDRQGRPFPSVYLARRAGTSPNTQGLAQEYIQTVYGLSQLQAAKVDRVAASTHNIKQRGQRVAAFLRRVAENPNYVGRQSIVALTA